MNFLEIGRVRRAARRLRAHRSGNVAITFGLCLLPLLLAVGLAVDYSTSILDKSKLQAATDSTVLMLARELSKTPAQLDADATSYLAAMDVGRPAQLIGAPIVSNNGTEVCIQTATSDPTTLGVLAKIKLINIDVSACAESSSSTLEIALVLDNSGSMAEPTGSGVEKIDALKTEADNFVSSVFASHPTAAGQPPAVRISVVPFQDAVAVSSADTQNGTAWWIDTQGQSSWQWNGMDTPTSAASGLTQPTTIHTRLDLFNLLAAAGGSSYAWKGCFESLPYPLNTQDATPSPANPDSLFVASFAPSEPQNYNDNNNFSNTYLSDDSTACTPASNPALLPTQQDQETADQERLCKYVKPSLTKNLPQPYDGPNYACLSLPMMRLSSSQSAIDSEISQMVAANNTNLNQGMMWGWRTISPNGPFQDGLAYGPTAQKVIVLMTDGMNAYDWIPASQNNGYKPVGGSAYDALGYQNFATGRLPLESDGTAYALTEPGNSFDESPALDELTREACANARAAGVQIYTIGFQTSNEIQPSGEQLLQDCAGDDPTHYFLVTDESSLAKAFSSISTGASAPRLVK